MGKLGDILVPLPQYVGNPDVGKGYGKLPKGPANNPIQRPLCPPVPQGLEAAEMLRRMLQTDLCNAEAVGNLDRNMQYLLDMLEANFPHKLSRAFNTPGATVNLSQVGSGGAGWTSIVGNQLDSGWDGYVKKIGILCEPDAGFEDLTFQLRINGAPVSKADNNVYAANSIQSQMDYHLYVPEGALVELWAINNGSGVLSITGQMGGWTTPKRRF